MSQIKKADIDDLVNDVAFAIEAVKQGENYAVTDKDIEEGISALGKLGALADEAVRLRAGLEAAEQQTEADRKAARPAEDIFGVSLGFLSVASKPREVWFLIRKETMAPLTAEDVWSILGGGVPFVQDATSDHKALTWFSHEINDKGERLAKLMCGMLNTATREAMLRARVGALERRAEAAETQMSAAVTAARAEGAAARGASMAAWVKRFQTISYLAAEIERGADLEFMEAK